MPSFLAVVGLLLSVPSVILASPLEIKPRNASSVVSLLSDSQLEVPTTATPSPTVPPGASGNPARPTNFDTGRDTMKTEELVVENQTMQRVFDSGLIGTVLKHGWVGEQPYQITPPNGTAGSNNIIGTWLYGYDGCHAKSPNYKSNIDEAYYDQWLMTNTHGVASDIDWNAAAALEFLGPPGINGPRQSQIQAVLANIATVIYSYKDPAEHYIHVRCDDPKQECSQPPGNDPCNPDAPAPTGSSGPEAAAYALNDGGDGYPMINFCDAFFRQRSLSNAIAYGTGLSPLEKLPLSFFHELTHLDLAANSPSPNPRITDYVIGVKDEKSGRTVKKGAYGPLWTKVLARYSNDVGYYVQRSADNYAWYTFAKYLMTKNGNILIIPKLPAFAHCHVYNYPYEPVLFFEYAVRLTLTQGPPRDAYAQPEVAKFVGSEGSVALYAENSVNIQASDQGLEGCMASASADLTAPITIDHMVDDSAYPADYQASLSSWIFHNYNFLIGVHRTNHDRFHHTATRNYEHARSADMRSRLRFRRAAPWRSTKVLVRV
ncbi:MAG: hypothetical protein Q9200_002379 [Gallowayella weberi]